MFYLLIRVQTHEISLVFKSKTITGSSGIVIQIQFDKLSTLLALLYFIDKSNIEATES